MKRTALLFGFVLALIGSWNLIPLPAHRKGTSRIHLGNERALSLFPEHLRGCRLGLVINHTSVLADGTPLLDAFLEKGVDVKAIFSLEHGFSGSIEGGETVAGGRYKNLPVFSLYGRTKKPTLRQMRHIDAFVYDVQDVGTRFYTYITTLKYVMTAASKAGKTVYVLDRPNPLGGEIIEGPLLKDRFRSFIGALPIPVRYGLTPGELALMMKGEGWIPKKANIHVLSMDNWKRSLFWEDTGLRWIPTSPNIPSPETAIAFPGTGILGGIILNQGLGTEQPFLRFGAPWLDTKILLHSLGDVTSFGIQLHELEYTPLSLPGKIRHPPYENRKCRGLCIRIVDREKFMSLRFTLTLIKALKATHADHLSFQTGSLSRLLGDDSIALYIKGKISFSTMMEKMTKEEEAFAAERRAYLLYD